MVFLSRQPNTPDQLGLVAQRQVDAYGRQREKWQDLQQTWGKTLPFLFPQQQHLEDGVLPLEVWGYPDLTVALKHTLATITGAIMGMFDSDGVTLAYDASVWSMVKWKKGYFPDSHRSALGAFVEQGNGAIVTSVSLPYPPRVGPFGDDLREIGIENNIVHFPRHKERAWLSRPKLKDVISEIVDRVIIITDAPLLNLLLVEDILHPLLHGLLSRKTDRNGAAGATMANLTEFTRLLRPKIQTAPHLSLINGAFEGPRMFNQAAGVFVEP